MGKHLKEKESSGPYCTGGIKCEKAPPPFYWNRDLRMYISYMGRIIKYGLEAGGSRFEGKCYVI